MWVWIKFDLNDSDLRLVSVGSLACSPRVPVGFIFVLWFPLTSKHSKWTGYFNLPLGECVYTVPWTKLASHPECIPMGFLCEIPGPTTTLTRMKHPVTLPVGDTDPIVRVKDSGLLGTPLELRWHVEPQLVQGPTSLAPVIQNTHTPKSPLQKKKKKNHAKADV